MTKATSTVKQTGKETARVARKTASQPWVEELTRLGYFVRGVLYVLLGIFAIQLALGQGGKTANQTDIIAFMGSTPLGKWLLIVVAVGLLGYTLWGLIRALFDPFRHGSDTEGLAVRLGYVASAFGYGTLLIATVQYIMGATMTQNSPATWSAKLLAEPYGRIIVIIIGLGWLLGGGLWQIYQGWNNDFKKDLRLRSMTREEKQAVIWTGKFGLIARGVVFGIIGLFLIQAAIQANPSAAKGFDGALAVLLQQPYGIYLLGLVAIGLMAFGVYSMLVGLWMHVQLRPKTA